MKEEWPIEEDIDNPDFEHQLEPDMTLNNYDNFKNPDAAKKQPKRGVPWYVWVAMAAAFLWLIFDAGAKDLGESVVDSRMQAHLDAMAHPLRDSQPSDFLKIWDITR